MILPAADIVKAKRPVHKNKLFLNIDESKKDKSDNEVKSKEDFGDDSGNSSVHIQFDSDDENQVSLESESLHHTDLHISLC